MRDAMVGPTMLVFQQRGKRFDQYFEVALGCNFEELLLLPLAKLVFRRSSNLHCMILFSAEWASWSGSIRLASRRDFRKLARGAILNGP